MIFDNFVFFFLVTLSHCIPLVIYQDVAAYIKKEFDKKFNPTWYVFFLSLYLLTLADRPFLLTQILATNRLFRHVIVGRNFGSYVTHETKHFIYFYLGQVAILLFKSG